MSLYKKINCLMKLTFFVGTLVLSPVMANVNIYADNNMDLAKHNKDYRTFYGDSRVVYGNFKDSFDADSVIYVAGNQFMVKRLMSNGNKSIYH